MKSEKINRKSTAFGSLSVFTKGEGLGSNARGMGFVLSEKVQKPSSISSGGFQPALFRKDL